MTEPAAAAEAGTATEQPTEPKATEPAKAEVDWKSKAREWEQRAKENKAKADAHDQFVESQKTAEQKLADERDSHKGRADTAERELARYRVAVEKGLPAELAARLQGSTPEELATDADNLLKIFGSATSATSFDGGARTPAGQGQSMNDLIRRQLSGGR